MKKNKKDNIKKLVKFEKNFVRDGAILLFSLWVISFFSKISLSSVNVEVERLKKETKSKEETNQALTMKINELASLENVNIVASQTGLAYNNGNIRILNSK